MQMNFHEPHDPMRWLNQDDISSRAATTVSVSLRLFPPCLPSPSVSTTTASCDIKGFVVPVPQWIFFVRGDIPNIQCYFREVFPTEEHQSEMLAFTRHTVTEEWGHSCCNNNIILKILLAFHISFSHLECSPSRSVLGCILLHLLCRLLYSICIMKPGLN